LSATSTLTLQCTGTGGNDQQSVTLTVTPSQPGSAGQDSGGGALDLLSLLALGLVSLFSLLHRMRSPASVIPLTAARL
jgi:hypothetical protein